MNKLQLIMESLEKKDTYKETLKTGELLKIWMAYNYGGYNYLTGLHESRGIRLYFCRYYVNKETGKLSTIQPSTTSGHIFASPQAIKRISKKAFNDAIENIKNKNLLIQGLTQTNNLEVLEA